jgi:Domain of unknown function (DUF4114)
MSQLTKLTLLAIVGSLQFSFAQVNVNYLGTFQPNGRPDYLLNPDDNISETFANRIQASLPDNFSVPQYYPQYLSQGVPSDIHLCEASDVWVTFFSESSLKKNTLAFYTYNTTNPLTIPPTSLRIVLPNASQEAGVLRAGNKVYLGKFPANTSIGFALLVDCFNTGQVNLSTTIFYSTPQLNRLNIDPFKKQSVLLCDELGARIFGFEETQRGTNNSDDDFNDLIFYVSTAPNLTVNCSSCVFTVNAGGVDGGTNSGLESEGSLVLPSPSVIFNG